MSYLFDSLSFDRLPVIIVEDCFRPSKNLVKRQLRKFLSSDLFKQVFAVLASEVFWVACEGRGPFVHCGFVRPLSFWTVLILPGQQLFELREPIRCLLMGVDDSVRNKSDVNHAC
jgi:hypothetical protein